MFKEKEEELGHGEELHGRSLVDEVGKEVELKEHNNPNIYVQSFT